MIEKLVTVSRVYGKRAKACTRTPTRDQLDAGADKAVTFVFVITCRNSIVILEYISIVS